MTAFATGSLTIPKQKIAPWLGKIKNGSAVATLSTPTPMTFGEGESWTFDIGEAEYVPEGGAKGASTVTATTKTVKPFKFHKTIGSTRKSFGPMRTASLRLSRRSWTSSSRLFRAHSTSACSTRSTPLVAPSWRP
jgi:hypothetical protein